MTDRHALEKKFHKQLVLMGFFMLLVVFGRFAAPHDPFATSLQSVLQPPSATYPFGTDHLGRCVLSRVLHGAPISVFSALAVVMLATLAGSALGTLSGYLGGPADKVISQVVVTFQAFPSFLLAVAVAGVLGLGLQNGILALVLVFWTGYARLGKSLVSGIKHENYLHVARLCGAKTHHIIAKYVVPNILPPIAVNAAQDVGAVILSMSALSFLGLGVSAPAPEWGAMMCEARKNLQLAPWCLVFPGLALFLSVACFNAFGDILRKKLEAN